MGDTRKSLTVLFSGRFDRPHVGHIASILRLGTVYGMVKVVVLDYPERKYCASYAAQMLQEILEQSVGTYEVSINKEHFAKIPKESLDAFGFDVYASGNHECLNHISKMGYSVLYVERAYDYEATDDRNIADIKKILTR
jgi:hypothetical protein